MKKVFFMLLMGTILCSHFLYSSDSKQKGGLSKAQAETKIKVTKPEIKPLVKTTLTMQEAVEIAYQNKPDLKAYKYAIAASKMRAKEALSGYLPSVVLKADYTQVQKQQTPALNAELDATQLIYSFAGPIEYYKQARKATQVVEYTNEKDKKTIRNAVEKAFLECWRAQQQKEYIQAYHTSSRETFLRSEHSNKLQLLDKSAWLKNTSDYASALASVDNYYETVEVARKKLEFFMGQPLDLEIEDVRHPQNKILVGKDYVLKLRLVRDKSEDEKDEETKSLGMYFKYAVENREELKIALKNSEIAKDSVKISRGSRLPTVNLFLNTGTTKILQSDPDVYMHGRSSFYTVSAQVSWPIFDGLLSYFQENEAHATMIKELLNKDQAAQQARYDVEQTYHTFLAAKTSFKAKHIELKYAKNELKLKKQQFKIGEISNVDLALAKSDYERYFYSWLDAKTDAEIKKRDLLLACGYPKEIS